MNSHAQNNEDLFILKYFGDNPGVFVDVGAHDGVQFSNTYLLEQQGWTGICIEPNLTSFHLLKRNRPKSVCIQSACVDTFPEHSVSLYVPIKDGCPYRVLGTLTNQETEGVASILQGKPADIHYAEQKAWGQRLDHILAGQKIKPGFELLSIDTEWTEHNVVNGASLDQWQPAMLMIEANNNAGLEKTKAAIGRSAKKVKYHYCGRVAVNHVWLRDGEDISTARGLLTCHVLK